MKRLLCLLVGGVLSLSLAGCGGGDTATKPATSATASEKAEAKQLSSKYVAMLKKGTYSIEYSYAVEGEDAEDTAAYDESGGLPGGENALNRVYVTAAGKAGVAAVSSYRFGAKAFMNKYVVADDRVHVLDEQVVRIEEKSLDDLGVEPQYFTLTADFAKSLKFKNTSKSGNQVVDEYTLKRAGEPAQMSFVFEGKDLIQMSFRTGDDENVVDVDEFTAKPAEHLLMIPDPALREGYLAYADGEDYEKAKKLLTPLADDGDPVAQAMVASVYLPPTQDDQKDVDKGLKYAQKSADANCSRGLHSLGYYLRNHEGASAQDIEKGMDYLRRAVLRGDTYSTGQLGYLTFMGEGVEKNEKLGFVLTEMAAQNGVHFSLCNLGYFYETGTFVAQDYAKAVEYYKAAIDKGDAMAMWNLALLYDQGKGMPVNKEEAMRLYKMAADHGQQQAIDYLAQLNGQ